MNPDGFLEDVLSAPDRLAATLDAYDGPGSPLDDVERELPRVGQVVFVGMGSSRFAALPVAARLRASGLSAVAELASTELPTRPSSSTLAVAISASGRTPETVDALTRHRRGGLPTVAVTNDPGSPLADAADVVLPLHSGAEQGGVACVTFQATLAVLLLLAGRLGGGPRPDDLRPAIGAAASLREGRAAWVDRALEHLEGAHTVYAVAPSARISSALQSALMFREGPRVPADAAETGDWLHVDVYLAKRPGYRALLFTGSRFDGELMGWAKRRASTVLAVGGPLEGTAMRVPVPGADDELVALLVETGVAELVAAEWWRRLVAADAPITRPE